MIWLVENEVLKYIKQKSWNNKLDVDAKGGKWYNISAMLNVLEKPFDEVKVATMCHEKATPGTKYWGMSVEEIIQSWRTKCSIAADRGMNLDTYIQSVLHNKPKPIIEDEVLKNKCNQFERLKVDIIEPHLDFIGSEIWLNSSKFGFRGRLDALFEVRNTDFLTIFDWKNNEEMRYNSFEKMLGPCDFLQKSDQNRYTIQLYMYKYLLEQEFNLKVKGVRIAHITQDAYNCMKPTFEYSKSFMEDVICFAIDEHNRRTNPNLS